MAKFMNKMRQYTSEKMGNTDKTELPNEFSDLCHKVRCRAAGRRGGARADAPSAGA